MTFEHKLYDSLNSRQRRELKEQYVEWQDGICTFCRESLKSPAPSRVTDNKIEWRAFPPGFLNNPVHLQHDHETGMTEGAVHAYCNAVLWQYYGK